MHGNDREIDRAAEGRDAARRRKQRTGLARASATEEEILAWLEEPDFDLDLEMEGDSAV